MHGIYAAGIRIKMFRYIQSLLEEMRQMADEYRLPIFFTFNSTMLGAKKRLPQVSIKLTGGRGNGYELCSFIFGENR